MTNASMIQDMILLDQEVIKNSVHFFTLNYPPRLHVHLRGE